MRGVWGICLCWELGEIPLGTPHHWAHSKLQSNAASFSPIASTQLHLAWIVWAAESSPTLDSSWIQRKEQIPSHLSTRHSPVSRTCHLPLRCVSWSWRVCPLHPLPLLRSTHQPNQYCHCMKLSQTQLHDYSSLLHFPTYSFTFYNWVSIPCQALSLALGYADKYRVHVYFPLRLPDLSKYLTSSWPMPVESPFPGLQEGLDSVWTHSTVLCAWTCPGSISPPAEGLAMSMSYLQPRTVFRRSIHVPGPTRALTWGHNNNIFMSIAQGKCG